MLFFEADAFVLEEVPDREVADFDAPLRQLGYQRPQGDIWLLGQAGQQPVTLRGQGVGSMSPHRTGRRIAGRPEPLRPLHDAGNAHTEGGRNLPATLPAQNRGHHSFAKIKRIWSSHRMLASNPSQHLESELNRFGNPNSIQINSIML